MRVKTFSNSYDSILRLTAMRMILMLSLCLLITSCGTTSERKTANSTETTTTPIDLDRMPLIDVSIEDILFAQTALVRLGYKIGPIDGIWGPKSSAALNTFEQEHKLYETGGRLSEANLQLLGEISQLTRDNINPKVSSSHSIEDKLDPNVPLTNAPQLVILDRSYQLMAKANPFSEVISVLQRGSGIYIIARLGGWYEIESLDEQRGYIEGP